MHSRPAVNMLERVYITYAALQAMSAVSGNHHRDRREAQRDLRYGASRRRLLGELFRAGNASAVIGRVGLRMLAELYITLAYMMKKG